MIDCLIVGDSIAVGVSQYRKECVSVAKVGITSKAWNKENLNKLEPARTLIISLGANDYEGINTEANVRKLRIKAQADKVFWLLPSNVLKPTQVKAVETVAKEFGDIIIPRPEADISKDRVHPTQKGYQKLAEKTK